jgi:hypothetical protein
VVAALPRLAFSDIKKSPKSRGRPAVGATPITARVPPDQFAALDAWIARFPDPKPSRPEAVRQILAGALGSDSPSSPVVHEVMGRDII